MAGTISRWTILLGLIFSISGVKGFSCGFPLKATTVRSSSCLDPASTFNCRWPSLPLSSDFRRKGSAQLPFLRMMLDDEDGGDNERIPGSQIAKEIEASFVAACTQMSSSYQAGLTAFAEAVITAYEEGYSVPSMSLELSSCPQQTLGRPLQPDEVELRQVWISLVYLTLQTVAHPRERKDALNIPTPFEDKFLGFVRNIVQAHTMGSTLERMKLEEVMNRDEDTPERSPMESAILSQAMRIVFITLDVLKQEAAEDGLDASPGQ